MRMKKLIAVVLALFIAVSCIAACAEGEYELTENEKNYVGAWSLYADVGSGKVYSFMLTFLDNMTVVRRAMVFKDGELVTDTKASGIWCGFTSETIIFSLAGVNMVATIKDDGFLYMTNTESRELSGVFSRCRDMSDKIVR